MGNYFRRGDFVMKFRLIEGACNVKDDVQAIEELIERMNCLAKMIELYNYSDWQPTEVAMWLQYEKDLALVESKLYTQEQEQQ